MAYLALLIIPLVVVTGALANATIRDAVGDAIARIGPLLRDRTEIGERYLVSWYQTIGGSALIDRLVLRGFHAFISSTLGR